MINFNLKSKNTFHQLFSSLSVKVGRLLKSKTIKFSLTIILFFLCTTQVHALTVSGTLYSDEGITPIASETIKIAVGTSTPATVYTTTTNGSGVWSFTFSSLVVGTPMLAWVDGNASVRGSIFTKASSTSNSITGLDLYQNYVILSHEGAITSTSTRISDLAFYDNDNDSDIQYNASSTAATLDITSGNKLYVKTGKFLTPTGAVTVPGGFANKGTFYNGSGVRWTARSAAEANGWTSVTYGNGLFVAVANSGTNHVMTSPDGITWTARTSISNTWRSVTYGNGLFVAVAESGSNLVMTSPDGITWTGRTAAEANNWYSVTYGNGLFVAVSFNGTNRVMTSPDGITWTSRSATAANDWRSVTYGNGLFVAVSTDGTNRVMTSPDGITWTARSAAEANQWFSVTYGNGLFVAVSYAGTNRVMTSPDGITWTARTSVARRWYSVTYGNGTFIALARYNDSYGANTGDIMISLDGISWTDGTPAEGNEWLSIVYGKGIFVAVTNTGTNRVMTSQTGTTTFSGSSAQSISDTASSITHLGNAVFTGAGTKTFSATKVLANDVSIESGATVVAPEQLSLSGNYTNNGTFDNGAGSHWTARSAAEANSWRSIAYGNGLFVALAITGTNRVMTSPDGITWTARSAAEANQWYSITYGNGLFVAVAIDGTNRVMTSPDGITWTARAAAEANQWFAVTYGNGKFVAVSNTGTNRVMTSPDGITWTARAAAEANSWRSITYGNGVFVAVSTNNTNRVMTSPDGITWTARTASANEWQSITYGDGLFVAVACGKGWCGDTSTTSIVMTSPDGITWTARSATEANQWYSITYGNGLFVAVSTNGTNRVMTSPDGITWTARSATEANQWYSITYGNGLFVAVAQSGTNRVMTSHSLVNFNGDSDQTASGTMTGTSAFRNISFTGSSTKTFSNNASTSDFSIGTSSVVVAPQQLSVTGDYTNTDGTFDNGAGRSWTARSAAEANIWQSVTYGKGLFVAVSNDGTNRVMTSPDGITWTGRTAAEANQWQSVTYGNGLFVAVSLYGTNRVMTSPDGITWTARSAAEANLWHSVTYGNSLFVAVSLDGTNRVMTSPDGTTWTARAASEANDWRSVTYGNGLFVAVSDDGTNRVMTSPDGITWTARTASEANEWIGVTYGNGLFVAVAQTGTNRVMTSPDGTTWTARAATEANDWYGVTYGNGLFVAVSCGVVSFGCSPVVNQIMTSPDGITWTAHATAEGNPWRSVVYGKGKFVAVSIDGTNRVMTSDSLVTLSGTTPQTLTGDMTATSSFANLTITNTSGMGSSSQSVILTDPVTTTGTLTMLASTSLQLPANATSTFEDISLEGTSGAFVWLRSSTPGTQANFYVPGTQQTVTYVNVKDSNACPGDIDNIDGYDAGNNTCWNFIETLINATTTNHTLGQVDNEFSFQNKTDVALFAFNLQAEESITITDLVLTLSGIQKLDTSDLINLRLYKDNNSDRLLDGGDTQIDASGIMTINGQHGAITFSSDFTATSSADYLLIGDTVSINGNAAVVISLQSIGITADVSTAMTNTVDYIQHHRNQSGAGSKADRIGGAPPDGDGDVFGGGDDGGGEVGQEVDGENIAADVNFFRPTATGDINNQWTNPTNAFLSDGVYATANSINLKQSYDTFGFNIPGSNTIEGIAVKLDTKGLNTIIDISLSWDGGSSYTTAKATPTLIGTDVVYTVGGASDKWGRSWTSANFSNTNFRLRVNMAQVGDQPISLDALEVRIFHQAGGGGSGGGGGI